MNIVKAQQAIEQLRRMLSNSANEQDKNIFAKLKSDLAKDAPINLKNKILKLEYLYQWEEWEIPWNQTPPEEISAYDIGISVIPGLVWVWAFSASFLQGIDTPIRILICISAWISYLMLGIAPYACILVAVGNGLLYVMTIWTLISHIPVIWLQYILKVIALIFVAMLELGLVIKVMGRLEE